MPVDPVAVDAGLMAEADGIMDEQMLSIVPNTNGQHHVVDYLPLRDAIYAALQAERERGAERMRERAAVAGEKVARGNGRAVGEIVATAIRALPLSETEK